jgi:hypothetical protein
VFVKKKRAKMGRPPIKAKDKRTACVTLRLKQSERKQLEQEAKAKDMTLSTYLLECWREARE